MANPAPLLHAPSKSTVDVDFAPALKASIANSFGENPESYSEEIHSLNRCRQDALRGGATGQTVRDLLYKYFGQLELLELRFPDLRIPFPWNDAFTHKHISQNSLAYEKAAVIFNIAASLAYLGATQNRASPEGLKRAFNFFRSASGMFSYIHDNFLHAPSADLAPDVVNCLIILMNAQATEIFYERMVEERKSNSLKARVSAQASSLYSTLAEQVRDMSHRGLFERSWSQLIQVKAKYFTSLAQYNRSLADSSASKYGETVSRLNVAENAATEAHRLAQSFSNFFVPATTPTLPSDAGSTLVNLLKGHLMMITEAKESSTKDNDFIYHDTVPSEATLASIDAYVVADPITIHEVYNSPEVQKIVGPDIFSRLVPLSVHESASLYSEEKAKLTRAEGERCDVADRELLSTLEHLGLPAALSKFRTTQGSNPIDSLADPGPQVSSWCRSVSDSQSQEPVSQMFEELNQLRSNNAQILDDATRELDVESYECEQARLKFGHLFDQEASTSKARTIRSDIKSHRDAMQKAASADQQAYELWDSIKTDVGYLEANDDGASISSLFSAELNNGADGQEKQANLLDADFDEEDNASQLNQQVESVDEIISRLNKIKKERNDLLKDLKDRVQSDDISQVLILNRKNSSVEPSIFSSELEKFRPHQGKIGATLHYQQLAIQELNQQFAELNNSKSGREIQSRWGKVEKLKKDLVSRFGKAYEGYCEVRRLLEMGLQFYKDLEGIVTTLQNEVKEYVSSRSSERSRLSNEANMKQRLGGAAEGEYSASKSPPPLTRPSYPVHSLEGSFRSMNIGSSGSPPPIPPASRGSFSGSMDNYAQARPAPSPHYEANLQTGQPFNAYPKNPPQQSSGPQQMNPYTTPISSQPPQNLPPQQQMPSSSLPLPPPPPAPRYQTSLPQPSPAPTYSSSYMPPATSSQSHAVQHSTNQGLDPYASRAAPPPPGQSMPPPQQQQHQKQQQYQQPPYPPQQHQHYPQQGKPRPPPPSSQYNQGGYY